MEKAIAVVVTYNRQSLLSECIAALRNQTKKLDAILVINNGSTDNTANWLVEQKDIFFVTQKNCGSAGGFNIGINWAFKHGYSWIWCMDDDGYPKEDALEKILTDDVNTLCLRNCAVINKEDKRSFVWQTKNYTTLDEVDTKIVYGVGHPFNGTMLHRNIIERVGLPQQRLFLWGDETEYLHRITSKNKIPVCTITDSIHYHPAAAVTYKKDWDYQHAWKMYFYIRNRFYIHKTKFDNKLVAFINYIGFLFAMAATVVVYQKTDKMKKMKFIFWPATDALTNNFAATPQTILKRLNDKHFLRDSINSYMKNIRTTITAPFIITRTRGTANA